MTTSIEMVDVPEDETRNAAAARRIRLGHEAMRFRPSQTRIAKEIGLTQQAFSRRWLGMVDYTLDEIYAICDFLELDVVWVLTGRKIPHPDGPDGGSVVRPKGFEPLTS